MDSEDKLNGEKARSEELSGKVAQLNRLAFSTIITAVLRFGIRIVKNIATTRLLGPVARGDFGLLTTIPGIVVSFGNIGFGLGSMYLIAGRKYDRKRAVASTIVFTLLLSILLMAVTWFVLDVGKYYKPPGNSLRIYLPFVIASVFFVMSEKTGVDLLTATKNIGFLNSMELLYSSLPLVVLVVLWLITGDALSSALYGWLLGTALLGIWSMAKVVQPGTSPLDVSLSYVRDALSYGARGYVSICADDVVRRIDYLFVAAINGSQALGYYAVSVSVAEILLAMPEAVSKPFLPIRFEMEGERGKEFSSLVVRHMLAIMLIPCTVVAIGGKLMIWILFGKAFFPAYVSMACLLPGVLALSVTNILKTDFYSLNQPGMVSKVSIYAMILNLALNFLLIPRYGIVGAAVASSLSYDFTAVFLLVRLTRITGTRYGDFLFIKREEIAAIWRKIIKLIASSSSSSSSA
ncbi:MAG: polysaccharide biosynthesis C-terminal domain-containing protein [Nitrospirae bacterium]|nr:polysaccharide biosynthesis C-terminal domain-containing protein [Nitrospirota bacterium]